jgi:retinoid hydroxylase
MPTDTVSTQPPMGDKDSGATTLDVARLPLPPGKSGLPFIGETIEFAQDPARFVAVRRARYGDVFRTHLIGARTVIMTDEDAPAWIFAGEGKYLQNKWNSSTRRLLGEECTAMLVGPAHAQRRALLMPHFRHSAMRAFAPQIQAISSRHFERWAATGEITVLTAMQGLVFEVIVTLLLGDGADVDIAYLSRLFRTWTAGIATLPIDLPFTTYHRALKAKTHLLAAIDAIVQARRRQPARQQDILGALLAVRDEEGRPLSQAAVVHELHNQLFAGHDTTVTVMTNLMLQLAQHPAALAQARHELQGAAPAIPFDLELVKQLPYLNAVLHESMRYLAPVSGTFRIMLRDMEYKGYRIPQGWTVRLEIAGTHTDERIWTNPFDFDPARWLPPRQEQDRRQHCFIPFGGGPRLCLGANFAWAEMRVMLALLLRAYAWQVLPDQDLSYSMVPFPRPKQGLRVRFSHAPAA